jgi:hypothetical protein
VNLWGRTLINRMSESSGLTGDEWLGRGRARLSRAAAHDTHMYMTCT